MNKYIWIILIVIAVNGLASYFQNTVLTVIAILVTLSCLVYLVKRK
ncbi:conserved hypothetical protein [Listeria monocytogenes]|nr:hypothetical protein LMOSLCC2540_1280 [Listeria monocytogenes SLCC2540]CUK70964.1 conserved hypothetical protein [Listeria monocytogenes]